VLRFIKFRDGRTAPHFEVNRANYEQETKLSKPWEQLADDGKARQYAICPKCDNPVQLIGIYKELKGKRPYGAHAGKDIEGLAKHNLGRYQFCPLSRKGLKVRPDEHDAKPDKIHIELYEVMKNNFDRVVYFIENMLDFEGSENFWRRRLETYVASGGYLFRWISLENLPWAFCYIALVNQDLYNQKLKVSGKVYQSIVKKYGHNVLPTDGYGSRDGFKSPKFVRIQKQGGKYIPKMSFRFLGYDYNLDEDGSLIEMMDVCFDWGKEEVFRQKITLDQDHFRNLLADGPQDKTGRFARLKGIAKESMPKI
jgi:hypothetical protein